MHVVDTDSGQWIYLGVIIAGFVTGFVSCLFTNKKTKMLSLEYLLYSYIIFLMGFMISAKVYYIMTGMNIKNVIDAEMQRTVETLQYNDIKRALRFAFSGYTFVGGYVGSLLCLIMFSKIVKCTAIEMLTIFTPCLSIMYVVLKVACFVKGCCGGIHGIPIQLIESVLMLSVFVLLMANMDRHSNSQIVGISLIGYGVIRGVATICRSNQSVLMFSCTEIICIVVIILGWKCVLQKEKASKILGNLVK